MWFVVYCYCNFPFSILSKTIEVIKRFYEPKCEESNARAIVSSLLRSHIHFWRDFGELWAVQRTVTEKADHIIYSAVVDKLAPIVTWKRMINMVK